MALCFQIDILLHYRVLKAPVPGGPYKSILRQGCRPPSEIKTHKLVTKPNTLQCFSFYLFTLPLLLPYLITLAPHVLWSSHRGLV